MNWKNFLLQKAVGLCKRAIPKNDSPKPSRILVVATTALGDTLWITPALKNLRRSFPQSRIAVLTSPIGLDILKHNPSVDLLFVLKEPFFFSFFPLWKTLYKEHFDTILLFHASQRLVLPLCSLLGANRFIGTAGINKGLDALLTKALPMGFQHEIVRRLKICEEIGAKSFVQTLSFFLQAEERLPAREFLSRAAGPWIAIHPGSKDAFKRWPAENFGEVGRQLKRRIPCEILITGNNEERVLMEQIASQIPGAHLYETNTQLRSFAALLEQMDLLISNDTGPVHLACALGRPVVALYSSTDPRLCGPHLAENALALGKRPTCDPCLKRKCRSPFCFLQIGVDEVVEGALRLLICPNIQHILTKEESWIEKT
ncbi:MAG: glycosyltransferase family 9 protein [Chlamydiota bacterium]